MAVDRHQAAIGLHQRIVAGQVAERSADAERGDRAIHDSRIDARGAGEVEPEFVDGARSEALDEHVGSADQTVQNLEPARRLQVEGQAFLVAIQRDEGRALAAPVRGGPRPGVVPAPGPLDLDDLGPHVSEGLRAERPRHVLGQVRDDDALQRVRHARSLSPRRRSKTGGSPPFSEVSGLFGTCRSPALESIQPMAPNADDLAKRVAALSERLSTLAGTLAQATQQLQGGTLPSESLADEITKVRTDFLEVRQRVM